MKLKTDNFYKEGYLCIKDCLSQESSDLFCNTLLDITFFHLKKVGKYSAKIEKIYNSKKNTLDKLSMMFEMFETNDKEMLYQLQKFFPSSNNMKNIINSNYLSQIFRKLLKIDTNVPLLIDGPGIFVNRPNTKRLLYKWHSESHYYPKRRNFLNIWFPIFSKKNDKNGTMYIKKKSHLIKELPFNEYQGFDKSSENKKNHFIQYEVPENFIKKLKTYKANLSVNDLLIFDRKAVHTSTINKSNKYSFAAVFRVWDISKDLTISGDLAVKPYQNYGNGRPDLIVNDS